MNNKKETQTHLMAVFSAMNEAVIVINAEYIITLANPAAHNFFQIIPENTLVGRDIRTAITIVKTGEKKSVIASLLSRVFEQKKTFVTNFNDNLFFQDQTPKKIPVIFSAAPIIQNKTVTSIVITLQDITSEKKAEEAQSNFIAIASHQLRTPLTGMRWFSEMLLSGDAGEISDQQKHFLKQVYRGVERMVKLVSILLQLARAESGKIKIYPMPSDLKAITQNAIHECQNSASQGIQPIELVSNPEHMTPVPVDEEALEQVIKILLSNALLYSPPEKVIKVSMTRQEDEIRFSIQDNGMGITTKDQPRIFERFFRTEDAVKTQPDGWGLNLVLAKYLVEAWGGVISFTSKEGFGSTFLFTIPSRGMDQKEGWGYQGI